MSGISSAILSTARNPASVKLGVVESYGGSITVNVDGTHPSVRWPGNYAPRVGDSVMVYIADGVAWVLSPTSTSVRPEEGKTTGAAVDGLIPVTGSDGAKYSCRYVGTAPAVGTSVLMLWQSAQPWILSGAVAASSATSPAPVTPSPPPSAPTSGSLYVAAAEAASYSSTAGWLSEGPRQGTTDGRPYQGAWWYGNIPGQLRGATATEFAIRVQRTTGGDDSFCSPQAFAVKSSPLQGDGFAAGYGPIALASLRTMDSGWSALPVGWAQGLVDGSVTGIGLRGGNYMRCSSLIDDAASGQVRISWRRD